MAEIRPPVEAGDEMTRDTTVPVKARIAARNRRERREDGQTHVGAEIILDVERVAPGGACVARHEGRVVFVRHTLPGERVRARVTEGGADDRWWRADAVEILTASPDRVVAPCPYAAPGRCGGCDWQHASLPAQRQLKAAVVAEHLHRLAGIDWAVTVEPADPPSLGWRTRMTYAVDSAGRAGLRSHRSHDVIPIDQCLIAHPAIDAIGIQNHRWPVGSSITAVASSAGEQLVALGQASRSHRIPRLAADVSVVRTSGDSTPPERIRGRTYTTEHAAGRAWRVLAGGFWQVHPAAADVLVTAVLGALEPVAGDRVLDLYCGVGLFAAAVAQRIGADGSVVAVDASPSAIADARRNLHDLPTVTLLTGRVDQILRQADPGPAVDLVILDPPRAGAKARVVGAIVERAPRAVAYIACDSASLARDLATFRRYGYELVELRAFDLFPMTHHVECVAVLRPCAS
jgi:tRNA/tmRNA/rRNA uracil-C5-methylase (TrmA/RlmC/RlmD family)